MSVEDKYHTTHSIVHAQTFVNQLLIVTDHNSSLSRRGECRFLDYCFTYPKRFLAFGQVHVLIDKTPLRRKDSTRACLAELERVRSEIRSAEGDGVNQLGVVGPLVERLASLLQMVSSESCKFSEVSESGKRQRSLANLFFRLKGMSPSFRALFAPCRTVT